MKTLQELSHTAESLRNRTQTASISAEETFGLIADMLQYIAHMEYNADGLGVRAVYASVEDMEADYEAPIGTNGKPLSLKEINSQINELLKASIQSEGVINLFGSQDVGEKFSLFDPNVLEEIAKMKEKNIVVEILKKLMAEQIAIYRRTNVVQATTFSEKITLLMNTYYNGLITNEEVIKELLKAAEEIKALKNEGQALGLSEEEMAFYDALTKPEAIKDFYSNEQLVEMTRELTEMLRKNRTIDWQKKETARAGMRKMVKRLLKKYKYPPEQYEDAIETVMSQCEMWTDN